MMQFHYGTYSHLLLWREAVREYQIQLGGRRTGCHTEQLVIIVERAI